MLFAVVVPVDHYATDWWRTLHQGDTLDRLHPLIHGGQLVTMLLSFVAFGLLFAWLLVHRYRLEQLEDRLENEGLEAALAARRAEGAPPRTGPDQPWQRARPTRPSPPSTPGRSAVSQMGYVDLGWGVAFGVLAAYALRDDPARGRKLSRALPSEERTWS